MQGEWERDRPLALGIGVGAVQVIIAETIRIAGGWPPWSYFLLIGGLWLLGPIIGAARGSPTAGRLALARVWAMGFPVALLFGAGFVLVRYVLK